MVTIGIDDGSTRAFAVEEFRREDRKTEFTLKGNAKVVIVKAMIGVLARHTVEWERSEFGSKRGDIGTSVVIAVESLVFGLVMFTVEVTTEAIEVNFFGENGEVSVGVRVVGEVGSEKAAAVKSKKFKDTGGVSAP